METARLWLVLQTGVAVRESLVIEELLSFFVYLDATVELLKAELVLKSTLGDVGCLDASILSGLGKVLFVNKFCCGVWSAMPFDVCEVFCWPFVPLVLSCVTLFFPYLARIDSYPPYFVGIGCSSSLAPYLVCEAVPPFVEAPYFDVSLVSLLRLEYLGIGVSLASLL